MYGLFVTAQALIFQLIFTTTFSFIWSNDPPLKLRIPFLSFYVLYVWIEMSISERLMS